MKTDRSALAGGIKPVPYRRPLVTWNPKESAPRFYDVKEAYPFLEDAILPHAAEILAEMKVCRLRGVGFRRSWTLCCVFRAGSNKMV